MPLKSGSSDEVISENISVLIREGKSPNVAKAIAMQKAGRSKKKPRLVVKALKGYPLERTLYQGDLRKAIKVTSSVNGHQHTYNTNASGFTNMRNGHRHPVTIRTEGRIIIGFAGGHLHAP